MFEKNMKDKFIHFYISKVFKPMMKQKKLIIDLFD
jgi:hypothetical protein